MATIEAGMVTYLEATSGVTSLVSKRIYPMKMPQNATLPALVYQRIAGPREVTHSGRAGLARAVFSFSCWAQTYSAAKTLAAAVVAAFDGYSGAMGTSTDTDATVINELDLEDDEVNLFRTVVDVALWYQEA